MLSLFIFLFCVFSAKNELEDFINKPIKIYFAGYGSTFLGIDTTTNVLVAENKYIDFKKHNFDPSGKIIKNGEEYEIYFRGKRMCARGKLVSECDTSGRWRFTRTNFGYTINKQGNCITKDRENLVRMKKCSETDDQIFNFKLVSNLDNCGIDEALNTTDTHKINVNIVPKVGKKLIRVDKHTENKDHYHDKFHFIDDSEKFVHDHHKVLAFSSV